MNIDSVSLSDFRCFRSSQIARLAPLTLIVGDNSTGKTSFLALVRALQQIAFENVVPDFKEKPYDLGSFAEIAHHRGGRSGRATTFKAGFCLGKSGRNRIPEAVSFNVTFEERATAPIPVIRSVSSGETSVTVEQKEETLKISTATKDGKWNAKQTRSVTRDLDSTMLSPMYFIDMYFRNVGQNSDSDPSDDDLRKIRQVLRHFRPMNDRFSTYASAPVRSNPRRTYDPARPARDPEGDYVPMYLAHLFRNSSQNEWRKLKERLETFGRESGLFDEITIKSLGSRDSEPFQLQVRKRASNSKGTWRNLSDVGYGVSQALPLITELLRQDAPALFLIQQPEVHLHPSAQAALGSLFCEIAQYRQLVVETHSDHLINRVRLDVRDGVCPLQPDDVSILYFERQGNEVVIHCLEIDDCGNVLNQPASYGRFFLAEMDRTLNF